MRRIKSVRLVLFIGVFALGCSSKNESLTIKSVLAQQLKNTHTEQNWFTPTNVAVNGLTQEQVNWRNDAGNHSIAELVSHLIFWNERVLIAFNGDSLPDFNDDNELTFKQFNNKEWSEATKKLDSIQTVWEDVTNKVTDEQLNEWSQEIANICMHNAYHTGQIVYIRKRNGWWD